MPVRSSWRSLVGLALLSLLAACGGQEADDLDTIQQPLATNRGTLALDAARYRAPARKTTTDVVTITVVDTGLNVRAAQRDTVNVTVTSTTSATAETVSLTETGVNTSTFTGSIPLVLGAQVTRNGVLEVKGGDVITVTYRDANDGTGAAVSVTATAVVDNTSPDLSLTALTVPATARTGATFSVTDTVANDARGAAAPAFAVSYYLADAAGNPILFMGSRSLAGLAPGASSKATTTLTVPLGFNGAYRLLAHADAPNAIAELSETNNFRSSPLTVVGPDLAVTALAAPASQVAGGTIAVTDTVSAAAGLGAAPGFTVGYYLGNAAGSPILFIGGRNVAGLAPGASSTGTTTLTLPLGFSGPFTIVAAVDAGNSVPETNESNNFRSSPFTLVGPDLAVTALSAPASQVTGGTIDVTDTVSAAPGLGTAPGFTVGYYLGNAAGSPILFIGGRNVAGLAPGASSTATTTLTIPLGFSGPFTIVAAVDAGNSVPETDETNNFRSSPFTVVGPDLVVTALSAPSSQVTGGTIDVTDTVSAAPGLGTAPGFTVGYYLGNAAGSPILFIGGRNVAGLAPGASNTATTTLTIPLGFNGPFTIVAAVDAGNSVPETDESNNFRSITLGAVVGPDLTVTALSAPAAAVTGSTIDVTDTVSAAAGLGTAPGFTVGYYLGNAAGSPILYIGGRNVAGLAPGASSTGTTTLTIPLGFSGPFTIVAAVDAGNSVPETDESNNFRSSPLTVVGPDLAVTALSAPTSQVAGGTIDVTDTVSAAPGLGTAPGFTVGYYLGNAAGSPILFIGGRNVAGLAPGASSTGTTTLTIPLGFNGPFTIVAAVDAGNSVPETDESNNFRSSPLTVVGPDLAVTALAAPASQVAGGTIDVTDTVSAAPGLGTAPGFTVGYYLGNAAGSPILFIGGRNVAGLAPGASSTATTTLAIPLGFSGPFTIVAAVDAGNSVPEADESNNFRSSPFTVVGPDLAVTALSAPAAAVTGSTIDVTDTVTAAAGLGTAPGFTVGYYLGNAAGSPILFIGGRNVDGLAPGASSTATTTLTIPLGFNGPFTIVAAVDAGNSVPETDESNNFRSAQISITP